MIKYADIFYGFSCATIEENYVCYCCKQFVQPDVCYACKSCKVLLCDRCRHETLVGIDGWLQCRDTNGL